MINQFDPDIAAFLDDFGGVVEFESIAEPFVGYLTDLVDSAQAALEGFRMNLAEPWKDRPLELVFVDSPILNAFATTTAKSDYVVITLGMVAGIYGTTHGLMSIPDFLPHVGDVLQERSPKQALFDGFPPMPLRKTDLQKPLLYLYPNDQLRFTFGSFMADNALHFLLWHEIGHIMAGHLDMLTSCGVRAHISERDDTIAENHSLPPKRVREYDADTFASHFVSLTSFCDSPVETCASIFGTSQIPESKPSFVAHASAITALFRLLGSDMYPPDSLPADRHPHPTVRSCLAVSRSLALATINGNFVKESFETLCQNSVFQVERTWASFDLPGQRFGPSDTWVTKLDCLSSELLAEYCLWIPKMAPFALPARWREHRN